MSSELESVVAAAGSAGDRSSQPKGATKADKASASDASLEARLAALEAAEKKLKEDQQELIAAQERIRALEDSQRARPVRPTEGVCLGDAYEFVVKGKKADDGLPEKTIKCCDESEALRWYVATTPNPKNPTKQVDPVASPLEVVCVDPRRRVKQKRDLWLAMVRGKLERGVPLTAEEAEAIEQSDMARIGLLD